MSESHPSRIRIALLSPSRRIRVEHSAAAKITDQGVQGRSPDPARLGAPETLKLGNLLASHGLTVSEFRVPCLNVT